MNDQAQAPVIELDVLIFGGGAAGLWLLRELVHRGYSALLVERQALGAGQTIAAQGILHGGAKYSLAGWVSASARAVRDMPEFWRECLLGSREPDLRNVKVLAERCLLWRTEGFAGMAGLMGAVTSLRSPVDACPKEDLPPLLRGVRGDAYRLHEQVISMPSLLESLAAPLTKRLLLGNVEALRFEKTTRPPGLAKDARSLGEAVVAIASIRPSGVPEGDVIKIQTRGLALCAGRGNDALRELCGLSSGKMQVRPLHMVLARGRALPPLYGHCIDGARTRATITSAIRADGTVTWCIGGQIAEDGVTMDEATLVRHARRELAALLPGLAEIDGGRVEGWSPTPELRSLFLSSARSTLEWSTYRVDRAEEKMAGGLRPEGPSILTEAPVVTLWPTKLVLVPELVRRAMGALEGVIGKREGRTSAQASKDHWPAGLKKPQVAAAPWEEDRNWQQ